MKAFIYLRVSTTTQEKDGAGLDVQLDVCTAYAKDLGYEVVRVFQDAWTGYEYRERPALTEMRALVRAREVDAVFFYAVDRLARETAHFFVLMDESDHAGVLYDSATEEIDKTPMGRLLMTFRATMAEVEREKIRDRTQGGLRKRVESGLMLAGYKAPYGYRWVEVSGKKVGYAIVEEEAAIVRRMFNEVAAGVTCRQVAKALCDDGIPSPGGGRWIGTNLGKTLRNPIYKGDPAAYRWAGYEARSKARKKGLDLHWEMQEGVSIKGGAPAIVDEALWKSVNAIINSKTNYRALAPKKHLERGLLRGGIAVCGYCGFALRHQAERTSWDKRYKKHRFKPREYACSPNNRHLHGCPGGYSYGEVLDDMAWGFVVTLLSNPELIAKRLASRKTEDPTKIDLDIIERQIKELDRKLAKIRELLPDLEEDFRDSVIADTNQLSKRRKSLLGERDAVLRDKDLWERSQQEIESVTTMLTKVRGALNKTMSYDQKRRILRLLNVKVRVFKKKHSPHVVIEWAVDPTRVEQRALAPDGALSVPAGALVVDTFVREGIHHQGENMVRFIEVLVA